MYHSAITQKGLRCCEKKTIVSILVGAITIILLLLLTKNLYPDVLSLINPHTPAADIRAQIRSHGITSAFLLTATLALFCLIPGVPTSMVGVLIGVYFGPAIGILLNIIGTFTGNSLSFILISHFKILSKPHTKNRWVRFISSAKHPAIILTISYMIPIIPMFIVNYTANKLKWPDKVTYLSMFIGSIPSAVLLSVGGDAIFRGHSTPELKVVLAVLAVGIVAVILLRLKKHQQQTQS